MDREAAHEPYIRIESSSRRAIAVILGKHICIVVP